MSLDFYCEECGLAFSVGGYGVRGSTHTVRFLLVCRKCGTMHEYRVTNTTRRPDRFLSISRPLLRRRKPDLPVGLNRRLPWVDCPLPEIVPARGPGFGERLTRDLRCGSCESLGPLTGDWGTENHTCPHCRSESLVNTCGWVT